MGIERQNWFEVRGDETLALDWPLTPDSHVWEIGGFEGRWVDQVYQKFECHITVFEPQLWAVERMKRRFEGIEKIDIRPYGLWTERKFSALGDYFTDGASLLKEAGSTEPCEFRSVYIELLAFKPDIDLCLMNIEGGEYDLIPYLIGAQQASRFGRFWCQFHPGLVENGDWLFDAICRRLYRTHEMIWDCYPTAVAWERKV